ncbi:hypothetical protein KIH13_00960 [Pseudomonas viridiflava]|nr:hypothetical protein KIH13_00960 [Pseudomonas viridiflava]
MGTTARTYLLTPALWRTLTAPKISQAPSPEPLLFLSQGVLHDSQLLGQVKLRTIQELPTLEALITVYIEGMETTLTTTAPIIDARLYATTQDIIHQNDAFNSVIFKVVSYSEQAVTSDIYLWEIPSPLHRTQSNRTCLFIFPKARLFM